MAKLKISVVIPAYNEEKNIRVTIKSIQKALKKHIHEVIVVDNNSTDNTSQQAKLLGARVVFNKERNIGKTRNTGAKAAKYPYLMFVDADSQVTSKLVSRSIACIKNKNVKAISAITTYKSYPNFGSRGVWLYNVFSYFLKLGVGQYMFVKKSIFLQLGCFNEDYYAYEELDFFRRLKNKFGRKSFVVLWEPIISSARKFENGKNSPSRFALNLLKALINPSIGKDKSALGFWYDESTPLLQHPSGLKNTLGLVIALMLVFDWFLIMSDSFIRNYSYITTPFLFLIMVIYLIRSRENIKWFVSIFLLTMFVEVLGVKTGFPFGIYSYNTDYAVIGILGVPIYIGFAWYLIITSISNITKRPFVTGLMVVLVDLIIEKFAYLNNLWFWQDYGSIFTSPLTNYLSWFVIGYLLYYVAIKQSVLVKDSYFILFGILIYMFVNIIILL